MNRNRNYVFLFSFLVLLLSLLLVSCKQELEVKEQYEFEISHLPYFSELSEGEVGEVRCTLKEEKHFVDRKYTIRYFPTTGQGNLRIGRLGDIMSPNDRYSIYPGDFILYYLPKVNGKHNVEVVVESDDGRVNPIEFTFNVSKKEEV